MHSIMKVLQNVVRLIIQHNSAEKKKKKNGSQQNEN